MLITIKTLFYWANAYEKGFLSLLNRQSLEFSCLVTISCLRKRAEVCKIFLHGTFHPPPTTIVGNTHFCKADCLQSLVVLDSSLTSHPLPLQPNTPAPIINYVNYIIPVCSILLFFGLGTLGH